VNHTVDVEEGDWRTDKNEKEKQSISEIAQGHEAVFSSNASCMTTLE
jgi:hypothetical protein